MTRDPQWIKDLEAIFMPYADGCHLREDAPQEAKDALNKVRAWAWEQMQ